MLHILFVENHAVFAAQVRRTFLSGHEVTIVPSLATARAALNNQTFDILLIDYDLDDGKGVELVSELARLERRPIMIAVSSHETGNAAMLAAGANKVCSKMEFQNIETTIEQAIGLTLINGFQTTPPS